MLVIVDKRSPRKAIEFLRDRFDVFEFISHDSTYEAIAGHPDIFMYQHNDGSLVVAPNSPPDLLQKLDGMAVKYSIGVASVGYTLKESTMYNCIASGNYFFHKSGFTDSVVWEKNREKQFIGLSQGYTRCSMFAIGECIFTSDKGIESRLMKQGVECCYVDPNGIELPPYKHGFIGGCCGELDGVIYFNGSLKYIKGGGLLKNYIKSHGYKIVELYEGSLYDGGGIFFV